MKLKPINRQVVVVMGGSSGIGRATALRFAAKGAQVVVAARNQMGLDTLVAEIEETGGKALAVVADTAFMDQVKHVADRAVERFGRIDTWVQVAAVSVFATFEQTHPEEFRRVIEVNLLGQIYGALAALPHLRKQGRGVLIHVSSVEGHVALPFNSAYAATKHGIIGFVDSLRLELEREGAPISVVTILPSVVDTPIFENALTRVGVLPRGPAPMYSPEVVARAIVDAAEHPLPNVVVGGSGASLIALKRNARRLAHQLLLTPLGFEAQLTNIPRSPRAPSNLFSPTPDSHLRVHGIFGDEEVAMSPYTRLAMSAPVRLAQRVKDSLSRVAARGFGALWALGHRAELKGIELRSGPGAGLPATVVREMRRSREPRHPQDRSDQR